MPQNRREFLRISMGAAGGLMLTVPLSSCRRASETPREPAVDHLLSAFLELDTRGFATVTIPVPEIGQGVRTSLAVLVAEELDVPWQRVRVRQAEAADEMGPHPFAGGSWSVRGYWLPFRRTGAAARALLLQAAAERWHVEPTRLETAPGRVIDPSGDRRLEYGELAADAAALGAGREIDPNAIALKNPAEFRLIGTDLPGLDTTAVVRGEARFGLDVRVEEMLRAVVARTPAYGGGVSAWDDTACGDVAGFHSAFEIEATGEADRPYSSAGVAVVANSTWGAIRAREALAVTWSDGPNAGESSADLMRRSQAGVIRRGETFREAGDVDRALARADVRVEARYTVPFLVHAPMEPMNCVVHITGTEAVVRAPTQVPQAARRDVAAVTGLDEANVRIIVERCGGGFGRRLSRDFLVEAARVAQRVDGPVQVMWTREDDMRHGFLRPLNVHRLEAGLDADGRLTAWLHRQAGTSRYAFRPGRPVGLSEFRGGTYPAALADHHRLEYTLVDSNLPRGPLRAPGLNTFTFAVESFLDEVAHAASRDPLELRLTLLEPVREMPYEEGDDDPTFDTGRMAAVLRRAAEAADWGRSLPGGRGLGIACTFTFGTYLAHVIEASANEDGSSIRAHRVYSAIDCGRVVDPNGLRKQVEGGVIDGLGAALYGRVDVESGGVVQGNFDQFRLLRMSEAPRVEVHWIESDRSPTGAGEPPYPPVLPALANAVFAASGQRLRDLPLSHGDPDV